MNKKTIKLIAIVLVLVGISFYAGTKMSSNKNRQQFPKNMNGAFGQGNMQFQKGTRNDGGNIFGKILSKDSNSITVELGNIGQNGTQQSNQTGSKIIFYTNQTIVTKSTTGTITDLETGKNVIISGTANTDGSMSATSIQIR